MKKVGVTLKYNITPFVKWVGGKRQLIKEIEKRMPKNVNTYYEPFVGGGALFMHLQNTETVINDYSKELTDAYLIIKDRPQELMHLLNIYEEEHLKRGKEFYYEVREKDRDEKWNEIDILEKTARFIYLNKACFNGLYRVNQKGFFNVPFNGKEKIKTFDRQNIENLSKYFNEKKVVILNGDFEDACKNAKKGDFIFFDPPYDLLKKDSFESYTKDGFGVEGQKRLAKLFKKLDKKGCYVMLTNHNTDLINELYKDYNIDVVGVKRMINSDSKNRVGVETIIYNYELSEVLEG